MNVHADTSGLYAVMDSSDQNYTKAVRMLADVFSPGEPLANLSLMDRARFLIVRQHDIKKAFAFDRHFLEQGFACLPERSLPRDIPAFFPLLIIFVLRSS